MALHEDSPRPLRVSIVGAGIAGLAAATALRQQGHIVEIFETSEIKTEVGAGISVQLNALHVLKSFGYHQDNLRGNHFDGAINFNAKSGEGTTHPWLVPRPENVHDLACLRSDLHDELKRLAISEGEGPPARLHLGNKVLSCNPDAGTVTLSNGQVIEADLVIGADGIHSAIRTEVLGYFQEAIPSELSCFRGVFDASKVSEIPELAWFTEGIPGVRAIAIREPGPFRMFLLYPIRNGTLVNFVGFYTIPNPDDPGRALNATREDLKEKYHDFHPKFLRILDFADRPLLRWQLRALPHLPTWIRGRTALVGDAAHGTHPFLGQGGAIAIEDAGALGCLFPLGTKREDVPARLEAYETLRKPRGEFMSDESIEQASKPEKRGGYIRSRELQISVTEYNALETARKYYEEHFGHSSS
ncbi:FAD/NAD(P)-binding domain-containing protein [Mycena sp. CBHHK59/15]|nr:FAD/NAD(P)-binding domain-containing protein [Mycena sp. CBHHK59/15]